jgi:hypothetical protein
LGADFVFFASAAADTTGASRNAIAEKHDTALTHNHVVALGGPNTCDDGSSRPLLH